MRINKLLYGSFLVLVLLLFGCAEDKGNYDYTLINEVMIDGIASSYTVELGGALRIEPSITSLDELTADLAYSWSIEGNEISTDKVLDVVLPPLDYGVHLCALTIVDNVSKMQYRETFNIEVVNPFNWGYYFFTRAEDGSTEMAYIQATLDVDPTMKDIKYTTGVGDYEFGNEPSQMIGAFGYIQSLASYYWTITFLTKEGAYPAIITDNSSFTPQNLITSQNFVETEAGYVFKPECTTVNKRGAQFFVSEGKFISYIEGKLYRPAQHNTEYYWSFPAFAASGGSFYWVFDEQSKQYYVIQPYSTNDPATGIYADVNAYDEVIIPENNREIKGALLYSSDTYIPAITSDQLTVYSAADDGLHIYTLTKLWNGAASFGGETILPMENLVENTAFAIGTGIAGNQFYLSNGNDIYVSPTTAPQLSKWASLPTTTGEIEYIGFSAAGTRMVVVTYDTNSSEERKGTVYFIDVETKQITHTFPNIIHRCVSFLGANSDAYGWGYGDAK